MNTFISLLKGINVGGKHMIRMEALKELYENLNCQNIKTYIQSGNIIFDTKINSDEELSKRIKKEIKNKFGFDIEVIIRSVMEWKKIIDKNPYPHADGNKSYVTFLSEMPKEIPSEAIDKARAPSESYVVSGKEVYVHCPEGYGKTKLSNAFFESKLKVSATSRNWNTIDYLYRLANNN